MALLFSGSFLKSNLLYSVAHPNRGYSKFIKYEELRLEIRLVSVFKSSLIPQWSSLGVYLANIFFITTLILILALLLVLIESKYNWDINIGLAFSSVCLTTSLSSYKFYRSRHYPFPLLKLHHFIPPQTGFTGLIWA